MPEDSTQLGKAVWQDLTVANAEEIRDFYRSVIGWEFVGENMGAFDDYNMIAPNGEIAAGICHKRGINSDVPSVWLVYITVSDLDASVAKCVELGGKLMAGPRMVGNAKFCVIMDPAGASCALYQPQK